MAERVLNAGILGLGLGAARIAREMDAAGNIDLFAAADIDQDARDRFHGAFPNARIYSSVEEMAADAQVEAVWVSTPNRCHAENVVTLAGAGKHCMVQKPMAITLNDARTMVEAAERHGVKLLAGHSQAYSAWIRLARQIIRSGELGALRAINAFASNGWLFGTRQPDDLDPGQGGGIVYRNAPHQIDAIRLLGGGLLKTVRGAYGDWMTERPSPGYYAAFMEFVDGVTATAVQNAYGYFSAAEFVTGTGPREQASRVAKRGAVRRSFRDGTRNEAADYAQLGIGKAGDFGDPGADWMGAWYADDLGIVVISCEHGDIRQSPEGIYVYDDDGVREIKLARGASPSTWYLQLQDLYRAVVDGHAPLQDGRWGMASLEVALGIVESAQTHRDVELKHQTALVEDESEWTLIHAQETERLA
jgi:phthalate 4,5-cis-dihydrodiol dehydrogenase